MKTLYLEAARRELEAQGMEVTSSRLSLMTGVHRKDVARMTMAPETERRSDLITRILGQWQGDERFKTSSGAPKVLPFENGNGAFADLVASVSREVSPYTVSIELQRSGIMKKTRRGMKLVARVYTPGKNLDEGFSFLEDDINDLVVAVEENLLHEMSPPNLHITTEYNNVPKESVPAIRRWFIREGEQFHRRAREFLSRYDRDIRGEAPAPDRVRVAVSSFSRVENLTIDPQGTKKD